jgi:hypothetical protein
MPRPLRKSGTECPLKSIAVLRSQRLPPARTLITRCGKRHSRNISKTNQHANLQRRHIRDDMKTVIVVATVASSGPRKRSLVFSYTKSACGYTKSTYDYLINLCPRRGATVRAGDQRCPLALLYQDDKKTVVSHNFFLFPSGPGSLKSNGKCGPTRCVPADALSYPRRSGASLAG